MDWNDWLVDLNKILREHKVQGLVSLVAEHWSHVRHGYKHGQPPQEVAKWLMERNAKYEVLESYADEDGRPTSEGRVIATNLTERDANRMIERLWDSDKVWWKRELEFRIGDKVEYEQYEGEWLIEKEICPGVYLIGSQESFCDSVPAHMLRKICSTNQKESSDTASSI